MQELANPEPARVIYAIDVLESLDKRNLVTPLLLYHESPAVRARALRALGADADRALSARAGCRSSAARMLTPASAPPRFARWLHRSEDAVAHRAAAPDRRGPADSDDGGARSDRAARRHADVECRRRPLMERDRRLVREHADRPPRRRAARSATLPIRTVPAPAGPAALRPRPDVARDAMQSVRTAASGRLPFVPALISLLRNRLLKAAARETLVGYGEPVVERSLTS